MKKGVVIFDIDGCIADDRHRQIDGPANTEQLEDALYERCVEDLPMNTEHVRSHIQLGHHILFITSRPARFLKQTCDWLYDVFGEVNNSSILMRPAGDHATCSPELKVELFNLTGFEWGDVVAAYDDRPEVLRAYRQQGVTNLHGLAYPCKAVRRKIGVPDILRGMADTFEERNKVYGDNYKRVAPIMKILFPEGAPPKVLHAEQFHLFELIVVKLTRFAQSDLSHLDSIHDTAVYAAMIESILKEES